jgi:hydroxymethylpyrimidine pyrophosphatase-like HAD family hydrolase
MYKGTIGLDIDGTITDARHLISDATKEYLSSLNQEGWKIVFITGREFFYAIHALSGIDFPYYLAVQNGADLIEMPSRVHLKSFYFDTNVVSAFERLFTEINQDFLLYSGYQRGDFCYFRPNRNLDEIKGHLEAMQKRSFLPWREVESFDLLEQQSFPMIKAIGFEKDFNLVEQKIKKECDVHCVSIKDPKTTYFHYLLATHSKASKKHALEFFMNSYNLPRPLIVGGDDNNDRDSLLFADVKVVMENAPKDMHAFADVIAPLSVHDGIIAGLKQATKIAKNKV